MKNIKYSLLTLTLLAYVSQIIPHYGYGHGGYRHGYGYGGGWGTGAALTGGLIAGTMIGAAASGRSESPESRNIRSIDNDIRYERKQINNLKKNKNISPEDRDEQIKKHNDNIQSLQRQRSTISA